MYLSWQTLILTKIHNEVRVITELNMGCHVHLPLVLCVCACMCVDTHTTLKKERKDKLILLETVLQSHSESALKLERSDCD